MDLPTQPDCGAETFLDEFENAVWIRNYVHVAGEPSAVMDTAEGLRLQALDAGDDEPRTSARVRTNAVALAAGRGRLAFWSPARGSAAIATFDPSSGQVIETAAATSERPMSLSWGDSDTVVASLTDPDGIALVSVPAVAGGQPRTVHYLPGARAADPAPRMSARGDLLFRAGQAYCDDLMLLKAGDSAPRVLLRGRRGMRIVAYAQSPSGRHVATIVRRSFGNELRILDLHGGLVELLAVSSPGPDLSWSPDGRRLLVLQQEQPASRVAIVDMESRGVSVLDPPAGSSAALPRWIDDTSISAVVTGPGRRPSLFRRGTGDTADTDWQCLWKTAEDAAAAADAGPAGWPVESLLPPHTAVASASPRPNGYVLVPRPPARSPDPALRWTPLYELLLRSGYALVMLGGTETEPARFIRYAQAPVLLIEDRPTTDGEMAASQKLSSVRPDGAVVPLEWTDGPGPANRREVADRLRSVAEQMARFDGQWRAA